MTDLSVVIPTYNERDNVDELTRRLYEVLEDAGIDHEILIVDDSSPDGTAEKARELQEEHGRNIRVILREEDHGLSKSVLEGFRNAEGDVLLVMDADLQHPPEKVPELYHAISDQTHVAVGSRYTGDGGIQGWSRFRKTVSRGATTLAKIIVPEARNSTDPVSGFFAVKKDRLDIDDLSPHGYKILLDVLTSMRPEHVAEIGFKFQERDMGESNLGIREYVEFIEHAAECRMRHHGLDEKLDPRRTFRFIEFAGVGASGVVINEIVFLGALYSGLHYALSGSIAFLGAVQWNFFWNWLITFDKPGEKIFRKYLKFHGVSLGGFVIYIAALAGLIEIFNIWEPVANIGAIFAGFIWNFLGSEKFAFRTGEKTGGFLR